ncbi:hypothetical protein MCOR27_000388 [Pyricularia oryzae]|uniref:Transmembrane 9 superfamily member n=5 Tax=Pyricularia TaxID=48558 RepID=A0ABQ8NAS8_PYRGI|nr:transmembrane 9 superfamily protein member 2 [Pyricularia oryzae 70-15]KAH8846680.1 hypothetical protein MCOR01_000135 [Pyricularia oryzae]KAI6294126.1 hypothetical protein MCOR33_008697 [Pyricularia grisea]EHA51517.1 transmembrane 9 superfamily protein member 2 [Pyricularia oryzae 70-15]KAH9428159.1 hypothetical protein MCOR02_011647 [Pyricularia oryzae]KAI6263036.1 hypothetical protein MCOR19_000849 [Pyricularia oryzae]
MQLREMAPSPALLALAAMLTPQLVSAFYLPGVAPTSYKPGDRVPLYVNAIRPVASRQDSMLHSMLSYDYYHTLFNFCQPEGGPESVSESLGSILFGDRIMTSPFELNMAKNDTCKPLCKVTYDAGSAKFVNTRIEQGYSVNWLVDGLPAGELVPDHGSLPDQVLEEPGVTYNSQGFSLGLEDYSTGVIVFNNHYDIYVDYHAVNKKPDQLRVVGVRVTPRSLDYRDKPADCGQHEPLILNDDGETPVQFSYSVYWVESPTVWATRWDKYLRVFDPKIHWFSLINSTVIVLVLVATVMSILVRALRKDIARYNRLDQIDLDDLSGSGGGDSLEDGVQEDSGWKLVHGDVFRTPSHPLLLSVFLGTGAQLFVMTGFTIIFALLGFLSPSSRGSLATILVLSYTVLASVSGYVSARVYKSFGGEKWKLNMVMSPTLIPVIVFSTFFFLNLFLWAKGSSGAVPFLTMLVIVGIWFVISVPLSVAGSFLGFRHSAIEPPVRTNQIPRQIPAASTTWLRPIPSMLLVGMLPFVVIFVELYFIMNSMWFSRVYYMFGFLFLCYGLMIVTTACVTILMVYFLLCAENYNWQWRSFMAAGASAFFVLGHAMLYWISQLSLASLAGSVIYLGYSILLSFLFFVLTGTIGFFASWWFTRKIYSSIKID